MHISVEESKQQSHLSFFLHIDEELLNIFIIISVDSVCVYMYL